MTSIIKVDQIQNAAGTDAIEIASDGSITAEVNRRNIPFIQLLPNSARTYGASVTVDSWRVYDSNGISQSGGVITVPQDGLYQVGVSVISSSSGGLYFRINGVNQFRIAYGAIGTGEAWSQLAGDSVVSLSANDTVDLLTENPMSIYGAVDYTTVGSYYMYLIG